MKALSHKEFAIKVAKLFEQTLTKFDSYMEAKKKEPTHLADAQGVRKLLLALDVISKKRTLQILYFLVAHDKIRFNELQKIMESTKVEKFKHLGVDKASSRTLSLRLKELERLGIVERKRYAEIPPRVEYSLTKKGSELKLPLAILYWWSFRWSKNK